MSLRRRVLIGFVVVAAALVATNLLLSATFRSYLLDRIDRQLTATADRVSRAPSFRRAPGGGPGGQAVTELYVAEAAVDGSGLARLGTALDTSRSDPKLSPDELRRHATSRGGRLAPFSVDATDDDHQWRVVAVRDAADNRMVVTGVSMDEVDATLWRMRLIQLAGSIAILGALAAVMWWILRLGVRPLASMAETADAIAGGDLSQRIDHADDRTEAGRLGTALNAMLDEIEQAFGQRAASEAKVRRFAADASHELRTPLTSILGYAELWRSGGLRSDEQLGEAMRRTEQEARRMAALVEDLLLLARLDQGRPPDRQPVRLDRLADDAAADARAVEPDRAITVDAEPVTVEGDELQLHQVVANLVSNARLHTPRGVPVTVTVRAEDGWGRLDVVDRGPGLPDGVGNKVFERFYRGDPTRSRAQGGSGLGLAIVAAITEAHGGRASVESSPGSGCRFTVRIPMASPSSRDAHHGTSQFAESLRFQHGTTAVRADEDHDPNGVKVTVRDEEQP